MIAKTGMGTIYPLIDPTQTNLYRSKPLGYMSDLMNIQTSREFYDATVIEIAEAADNGRDFISDIVEVSTWYEPPKNKGTRIDVWA